jgi:hypothetical protein
LAAASRRPTFDISVSLNEALGDLVRECQRIGRVRADLVVDDVGEETFGMLERSTMRDQIDWS